MGVIRLAMTKARVKESPLAATEKTRPLPYDAADQLTSVTSQDPVTLVNQPTGQYAYSYDPAGNRLTETIDGVTSTASYNSLNQLISLTGGSALPAHTYEWDGNDRLIAINYTGTYQRSEFQYDGLGRRRAVLEKDNGNITDQHRVVWDGARMLEERETGNASIRQRHLNRSIESEQGASQVRYLLARDQLGSIRHAVSIETNTAQMADFDPWGRLSGGGIQQPDSLGYSGHWHHRKSSFDIAPFRAFSPHSSRWLNRDPLEDFDDFNLYRYAGNVKQCIRAGGGGKTRFAGGA